MMVEMTLTEGGTPVCGSHRPLAVIYRGIRNHCFVVHTVTEFQGEHNFNSFAKAQDHLVYFINQQVNCKMSLNTQFPFQKYAEISLLAVAGIAVTALASACSYHLYLQKQKNGEPPIKKSWLPLIGMALEMGSKPIQMFQRLKAEFGDVFGMIALGNRMFIITDPHSYHLILNANPKELSVQEFFDCIETKFFGLSEHPFENNAARVGYSKYLFADSGLTRLTERMQNHMQSMFREVKPGRYQLQEFVSKIIFHSSIAALFNDEAGRDLTLFKAFCEFDKCLPIAAAGVNVNHVSSGAAARKSLIEACLKHRENESEFVRHRWQYLDKLFADGDAKFADSAVRYQVAMMWASVANTMPATFWLMYFILSNHSILSRVVDEIQAVCDSDEKTETIHLAKLNKLVLLNACITETLRLSSGSLIMRIVKKPVTLTLSSGQSFSFRKGDHVGLCPPLTHMDSDVYEDPAVFNPDRWLQGSTDEQLMESSLGKISLLKDGKELPPGVAYLPFGGGATLCPGRKFARNEVKTLAVYLLKSFKLSLVNDDSKPPEFDGSRCGLGIFPPKNDIYVNVDFKL
jgi:cholesterol 7alpha-monooxygenase